jgi:hypothetical protein
VTAIVDYRDLPASDLRLGDRGPGGPPPHIAHQISRLADRIFTRTPPPSAFTISGVRWSPGPGSTTWWRSGAEPVRLQFAPLAGFRGLASARGWRVRRSAPLGATARRKENDGALSGSHQCRTRHRRSQRPAREALTSVGVGTTKTVHTCTKWPPYRRGLYGHHSPPLPPLRSLRSLRVGLDVGCKFLLGSRRRVQVNRSRLERRRRPKRIVLVVVLHGLLVWTRGA